MGRIQYPIEVSGIKWSERKPVQDGWSCNVGDMVRIRPVAEQYGNKTYLGVYIGDIAQSILASHNKETKELEIGFAMHNPAIFVPDLNKVIYGMESWWGRIDDKDDLKDITDDEINNVWYVRALKQIADAEQQESQDE